MHILSIHNYYQYSGGEDAVVDAEAALFEKNSHTVTRYTDHNSALLSESTVTGAANAVWSQRSYETISQVIQKARPDIVHFHNTFLRISPAAYWACKNERVPVIQTLHNYRLLCPAANFFRDGQVCEDCLGKIFPWPSIYHGCWQNSQTKTMVPAMMLTTHRLLGTWQNYVDTYIVLTKFAHEIFVRGGLPKDKIVVKPNFAYPDPGYSTEKRQDYFLFVGRLSPEKGVERLIDAWQFLPNIPLKVVGDGPLFDDLKSLAAHHQLDSVVFLGRKQRDEVLSLMKEARCLVFQSACYEGFPVTIAEAFACGLPVLAPNHGAMSEIVSNGKTGLHFRSNDAMDLAMKAQLLWNDRAMCEQMGIAARHEYELKYSAERNYDILVQIYEKACQGRNHS